MTEKPLHVRVAEAIGWSRIELGPIREMYSGRRVTIPAHYGWGGEEPDTHAPGRLCLIDIPRYDTDWSATGPLIERFHITVGAGIKLISEPEYPKHCGQTWTAVEPISKKFRFADTPLEAACLLILTLGEAGLLTVNR